MKKEFKVLKIMFFTLLMLGFAGCKKEKITLSRYELWFPSEASVQDIQLTANCDWTVSIDDGINVLQLAYRILDAVGESSAKVKK